MTQSAADSRYALKTVTISAGAGLAGGGNLSANRTLSLAAVGTAGTYTKVTVDAYGRVTAHASLSAADIPSLSISKISGLQSALDKKLEATAFTELFEKVTLSSGETAIRAKLGLYSDKWLSAKGANPNQGEGGGGFAYTRLDTWEGYDSATMDGWVLSAKLGYSLYNDVKSLKAGAAVGFTIEGTGNAITDITKNGTQLVFTRGMTFALSSHQHLLSNLSDLNNSWRTLLKAAPSAYVTRWPSFSEVTSKPTTLAGYGITDAATSSHTHSQYLTGITKSMVEAVLTGNITSHTHSQYLTSHQAIYALTVKAGSTSVLSFNPKTAAATLTLAAGSGISLSADATNKKITITGTYKYTHPSATATTIAAATGKVLSAITVNSLGHVTSVAAKTLAAGDIPTLAISKISGLQSSLDSKLAKATFDDLFEKVTLSDGTVAIHAKYGFYSDGFVSGKGANPSAGEGGGTAYNRLDTWEGYTDELATWVLSAGLGHSLYNDVQSLKRGAAVSFTIQGSGNAITDVTKSGTSLTHHTGQRHGDRQVHAQLGGQDHQHHARQHRGGDLWAHPQPISYLRLPGHHLGLAQLLGLRAEGAEARLAHGGVARHHQRPSRHLGRYLEGRTHYLCDPMAEHRRGDGEAEPRHQAQRRRDGGHEPIHLQRHGGQDGEHHGGGHRGRGLLP